MDVPRLIDELRTRPALWDTRNVTNKWRYSIPELWKEVSNVVGSDVEQCKRKWKNLRDAYRAEVRRAERRVERDKLMGEYDPNANYNSKWVYFEPMSFINDCKRPHYSSAVEHENTSSNDEETPGDGIHFQKDSTTRIRLNENVEQRADAEYDDNNTRGVGGNADDDDDDAVNDMLFEEFQSIATPQAARRLSVTLSLANSLEQNLSNSSLDKPTNLLKHHPTSAGEGGQKDCKCPPKGRSEDRVHFLEDLEKEEQKLIKSTKRDINRALSHIGDSDYNFLVSFLPHMKKMTDLQNLQFRGRMCDLVLSTLAPSMSRHNSPAPPPLTPAPIVKVECGNSNATALQPESTTNQEKNSSIELDNDIEFFSDNI
ncbi:uncharacterized protein LOC133326992 [Musca vetustissima]|uniref:uncharacterized protein LOC133326992 n=1 Tax=Musca vetustissima TaxID=27455 RepID=UPI002AB6F21D|nr:uncharacterized protein LOC133326992 [Musca vetustissima]